MSQTYNLNLNKGDSYKLRANLTIQIPDFCIGNACSTVALDLTDKIVKAQIKQTADSCASADFVITFVDNDPTTGIVDLFLSATESNELKVGTNYFWDLRVYDNNSDEVFTAFKGTVTVSNTITD